MPDQFRFSPLNLAIGAGVKSGINLLLLIVPTQGETDPAMHSTRAVANGKSNRRWRIKVEEPLLVVNGVVRIRARRVVQWLIGEL